MKRYLAIAVMCVLLMGCATLSNQQLIGLADIALDEILAITGDENTIRDWIADNPEKAEKTIGRAQRALRALYVLYPESPILDQLLVRLEGYTGEFFDVTEPLRG